MVCSWMDSALGNVLAKAETESARSRYLYYLDQMSRIQTLCDASQLFQAGRHYQRLIDEFGEDTGMPKGSFRCEFRSLINEIFKMWNG